MYFALPRDGVENRFINRPVRSDVIRDRGFLDLELGNLKIRFSLFTLGWLNFFRFVQPFE